jgi:hypothetical protein
MLESAFGSDNTQFSTARKIKPRDRENRVGFLNLRGGLPNLLRRYTQQAKARTGGEGGIRTPMDEHSKSSFTPDALENASDYPSGGYANEIAEVGAQIQPLEIPQNALPPQLAPQSIGAASHLLARVVAGWMTLSPQIQQAVVSIVEEQNAKGSRVEISQ